MAGYIIKSIASASVYRALGILSSFLITVVLARMLQPDELGQYFLAFSAAMFLSILMRFGIKQTALRLVTKARLSNDSKQVTDTIQKIVVFMSASVIVVIIILSVGLGEWVGSKLFHSEEISKNFVAISFWAVMLAFSSPIGESLRGLKMPAWGAALDNSASSFIALLVFLTLYFFEQGISLSLVVLISAVSVALVIFVSALKLINIGNLIQKVPSYISYREIYNDASPILIINIATYLTANASLWIVAYFLSHEDVAVYGAVIKLFNLIAVPLLVINIAIEPSISEYLHHKKRKNLDALLRLSATLALIGTLLISALVIVWGDLLLVILFGEEYVKGYIALIILVLGNIVNVWTGSCASMMLLGGFQIVLTKIRVVFGVVSIVLSLAVILNYGIEGVAVAVSLTVAFTNFVTWKFVKNKMQYDTSATIRIKNKLFIFNH